MKSMSFKRAFAALLAVSLLGLTGCEAQKKEVLGELSYDMSIKAPRDDANEIRPEGNRANIMNPITGGAEALADELRTEILKAEDTISVPGKTYYISPDGDDINDGLSPEQAFRTIDVLNWLMLSEGDAVLFERDSVFRITEPIVAVEGVTYGAYGTGDKPCIYGSPKNYADASLWTPSRMQHVWKIDFGYGDVGNIVFNHGEYVGIKKQVGINQLQQDGDFYHNKTDGIVYLYYEEGNPGKCYQDIEISPDSVLFVLNAGVSNVTIDNLCMKYVGAFAVSGLQSNNGIKITNCEMGYIGGSNQNLNVRLGNAIQFWNGTQDCVVQNNWIYQCFDCAITFQGTSKTEYSNINFSNNLMEYNDMDIELWDRGENFTITNLKIESNIMRFTAHGWGTRIEDAGNRGGSSGFIFHFDNCVSCDITMKNNIFDCQNYYSVNITLPLNGNYDAEISGNSVYMSSERHDENVIRYGVPIGDKKPAPFTATNQGQLETAFHKFDSLANVISWIG